MAPEQKGGKILYPYKLLKPRCRTSHRLNTFTHRIVNPWNSLPDSVVDATSITAFERRLDKHWANLDMKYVYDLMSSPTKALILIILTQIWTYRTTEDLRPVYIYVSMYVCIYHHHHMAIKSKSRQLRANMTK